MRLEDFVSQLKHALEEHSVLLQRGDIFLPKYLKGKISQTTVSRMS